MSTVAEHITPTMYNSIWDIKYPWNTAAPVPVGEIETDMTTESCPTSALHAGVPPRRWVCATRRLWICPIPCCGYISTVQRDSVLAKHLNRSHCHDDRARIGSFALQANMLMICVDCGRCSHTQSRVHLCAAYHPAKIVNNTPLNHPYS